MGQKKYEQAEPLLLSGYEGMQRRARKRPDGGKPRLEEAAKRLVKLFEDTGRTELAADWRKRLEKVAPATITNQPPPTAAPSAQR